MTATAPSTAFDRDAAARRHAVNHTEVSPGISAIYYLPTGAPPREVRLIEVSEDLPDLTANPIEPVGFGIRGDEDETHWLEIADVSRPMWTGIRAGSLKLPAGWTLDGAVQIFPTPATP